MNDFIRLRKTAKRKAVEAGIIKRVTSETGKDKGTVSRTFSGAIKTPDPKVVVALHRALADLGIESAA